MKTIFSLLFILSFFHLPAQEKGVTPVTGNSQLATGNTYAVVVGISDYQDENIPDLRFADKDAEAFANFLRSPAGGSLDEDHLKVLLNEQATQAGFAGALDWLWEVAKENDRVFIYFSGHGDVEKKSLTQPGFLLCWDAPSRVYMAGGAFPLLMLQEVISTISEQNKAKIIMVADACRAGKLSGSKVSGAQITGSNLAKQYANELKILSCQPDEYSIEGEQWGGGHGVFSYHLLDGLYGMADANTDQSVSLLELSRYLEDKVSMEVAPQSQIPLTVGDRSEKLTDVFPELLSQINESKKGQMKLFAAVESRGIEDDVLAQADSINVQLYYAFKKALEEKRFFPLENESGASGNCADTYFEKLIKEPQMERLHASIRRNYAVALQNDAQQALIELMKVSSEEKKLSKKSALEKYHNYPLCLERAADILGEKHYMYKSLKARQYFFEALILKFQVGRNFNVELGNRLIDICRRSLGWQNTNALVIKLMADIYGENLNQRDSMMFYTAKAINEVPTWQLPYFSTSWNLYKKYNDFPAAMTLLENATIIDTTAELWNTYGMLYFRRYLNERQKDDLALAETYFLKTIALDSNSSRTYNNLGFLYNNSGRPNEGEKFLRKGISIDSTQALLWANLAISYQSTDRFQEAINTLQKIISLDSTLINTYVDLGVNYSYINEIEKAKEAFDKAYQLDSTSQYYHEKVAIYFMQIKDYDQSEWHLKKLIEASNNVPTNLYNLACIKALQGDAEQSYKYLYEALENGVDFYDWMQDDTDLSLLRKQPNRWDTLMKKYFPEQHKN